MIKPFAFLLLCALCTTPLLAQEDAPDEVKAPAAADAAMNKGYRAEEAAAGSTGDDSAPDQISGPASGPKPGARPKPAAVGQAPASFSQRPGSGEAPKAAAAGISCDKSVPKLASVVRKNIDFVKTLEGPVTDWEVSPNEAVVYRFKTPRAGAVKIFSTSGHLARPVATLMTVSETPCDFDTAKSGQNTCYSWGPVENGVFFAIAPAKAKGCVLKPDTDYYFSIRSLSNPGQGETRDACADEIPFFDGHPKLPRKCGGIWKLQAY